MQVTKVNKSFLQIKFQRNSKLNFFLMIIIRFLNDNTHNVYGIKK